MSKDGNTSRALLLSFNKELLRTAMLIIRGGFYFPKLNGGRVTLSIPADAHQNSMRLTYHNVASRSKRSISLPASSTSFFAFILM